jgi:hypothetical protein
LHFICNQALALKKPYLPWFFNKKKWEEISASDDARKLYDKIKNLGPFELTSFGKRFQE